MSLRLISPPAYNLTSPSGFSVNPNASINYKLSFRDQNKSTNITRLCQAQVEIFQKLGEIGIVLLNLVNDFAG